MYYLVLSRHKKNAMTDQILTIKEVAEHLRVNERTVYRLAGSGELPGFKVANTWRFQASDIQKWIESRKNDAAK